MKRTIAVIGTLDTKGDQIGYLKEEIKKMGHQVIVIDVGVLGEAPFKADISRNQVAEAAGVTIDDLIAMKGEAKALNPMIQGACSIFGELNKAGSIDGMVAVGGSMGTALALDVVSILPLGLPKLILSTIAYSPAISPERLSTDLLMMPWVGGLWGINEVSKRILEQAAGIIVGAAEAYNRKPISRKILGVTSLGMSSSKYLYHLRPALEKKGYEVSVFHATGGMSGRLLEKAIEDDLVEAVLDMHAGKELINEVCGSPFSPGSRRLEAAAEKGIPQIISVGTMELAHWPPDKPLPEKFANRRRFNHNPLLAMFTTSSEEKVETAKLMAQKINKAKGPVAVVVPTKVNIGLTILGVSDPEGLEAFRIELKKILKPEINILELDCSTDDELFSREVVRMLDEML